MKSNYKRLGDYIQLVNKRNSNLQVSQLLGINITKNFKILFIRTIYCIRQMHFCVESFSL